jgi:Helix-turn-helix domain (DUF4817)
MERRQLSVNDKIWIVKNMYRLDHPITVQRKWCREVDNEPPSRPTINSLIKKFEETGSVVNIQPPGRPITVTDEVTKDEVASILEKHPETSIRSMSSKLTISRSSIHRVYEGLGFKPYIPKLIHELNEDDFDRRIEFCETFLSLIESEPDIISRVIWSDEAVFKLNGVINRHNSVYWAKENPNITYEHTMQAEGVTVWGGLWYQGVIGPYFFEDKVTAKSYLSMLNDYFYPLFRRLRDKDSIFLMQDGAPAHYAIDVRQWLNKNFTARWIGRRGPIDWPARSPDLTPADFFLWGYIKDTVYKNKPRTIVSLKQDIISAFQTIHPDMCKTVCESVPKRLRRCIDVDGKQFEHLQ